MSDDDNDIEFLDSKTQVKRKMMKEFIEWCEYNKIEFTFEQSIDLVLSIHEALDAGKAYHFEMPETVSQDEEHFNTTYIN